MGLQRATSAVVCASRLNIDHRRGYASQLPNVPVVPACALCPTFALTTDITLDPGFETFYHWCKARGIPLIIVSSGMAPIIRAVLEKLVGVEQASEIEIIANDVKFTDPEGKGDTWEIVFRHPESGFGHDKSRSIIPYRDIPGGPTLFFAGDGVSGGYRRTCV